MKSNFLTEHVGSYAVTPLTLIADTGRVAAAVSIRRGTYDRVFRFTRQFDTHAIANKYALDEGRSMVLGNQLS